MRRPPVLVAVALLAGLVTFASSGSAAPAAPALDEASVPSSHVRVVSATPPGQSGFFGSAGQAMYEVTQDPSDFGPHVDDQRDMYWSHHFGEAGFTKSGTPVRPKAGVAIYRDARGIPSVYGATAKDVWWGAGYAIAQDRLFEMDGVRRTARGTLAALAGAPSVPDDVQTRILTYTDREYAAMYAALPRYYRAIISAYVTGANAWREHVLRTPSDLPIEYQVLSALPAPFTVTDVLASGVYMTRYVASQGGDEMANVATLRALEKRYGKRAGRGIFRDFFWQEDRRGVTSVPRSAGIFDNNDTPPAQRSTVFRRMADYADRLPLGLATGYGTGAYPEPGTGNLSVGGASSSRVAGITEAIASWARSLHGGSFGYAVAPKRTRDGKALLESAPQLSYSYPSLLAELEVHGGGYDARGATVPMLPVVGIGHNRHVAWALTTGYSKTVDSFVERTRPNPVAGKPFQYRHDGRWVTAHCHTAVVHYRQTTAGVPVGPPSLTKSFDVCRTVHGPVVARVGHLRRSVQYAMWKHEVDTIKGVIGFDRARGLDDFRRAVRKVTWNENVIMADDRGHIAYWHPGRYPRRSARVDQRFPVPGSGGYDWSGMRPFRLMPHVIDPKRGWVASWNNKPAVGWNSGDLATDGGYADHVRVIMGLLQRHSRLTFAGLRELDRLIGDSDARAQYLLPPLLALRDSDMRLTTRERSVLAMLARWNREAAGPGAGGGPGTARPDTDGPAATTFEAYVTALRHVLFGGLPRAVFGRAQSVGQHRYEPTPMDDVALHVLRPQTSSFALSRSYLHGHTRVEVVHIALRRAIARLTRVYGSAAMTTWRRPHPTSDVCSLTGGAVGPCLTMPYEDRGTYEHLAELG